MTDSEKEFPSKVIRTWSWHVNRTDYHLPDSIDSRDFYCRCHIREKEDLLPYLYEGQNLYVCRICGTVYEILPRIEGKASDRLKTWHVLFQQPYDWKYIKTPTQMNYHFVHECEGITTHPLLNAHGGNDRSDSLELIARFFSSVLWEEHVKSVHFFTSDFSSVRVFQDDQALVLSSGTYPGRFPGNEYCVYREESDSLTLEVSHSWEENICGFTSDLNEDDYEEHAEYRLIKFTFLGDDGTDLKDRQHELNEKSGKNDRIPDVKGDLKVKRLVVRDPFGLNGSFLYENIRLSR